MNKLQKQFQTDSIIERLNLLNGVEWSFITKTSLHVRFLRNGWVYAHWYPATAKLFIGASIRQKEEEKYPTLDSVLAKLGHGDGADRDFATAIALDNAKDVFETK